MDHGRQKEVGRSWYRRTQSSQRIGPAVFADDRSRSASSASGSVVGRQRRLGAESSSNHDVDGAWLEEDVPRGSCCLVGSTGSRREAYVCRTVRSRLARKNPSSGRGACTRGSQRPSCCCWRLIDTRRDPRTLLPLLLLLRPPQPPPPLPKRAWEAAGQPPATSKTTAVAAAVDVAAAAPRRAGPAAEVGPGVTLAARESWAT